MKKIILLGIALLAMVSCEKYDDSELWEAIKNLQADTVKEESTSNVIPRVVIINGALPGEFSVATDKKVKFSMGNLQYRKASSSWRFADEQYQTLGLTNISIGGGGWNYIDLFGWGTSGWNSGAVAYLPTSISTSNPDYYPGNSASNNLTGKYAQADWGVFNKIGNGGNVEGKWRTLTSEEWTYLFKTRIGANKKWGAATIGSYTGIMLLPDNWNQPANSSFTAGNANGFTTNIYSILEWKALEASGVVFLPAAGSRSGSDMLSEPSFGGSYWSSTSNNGGNAFCVAFDASKWFDPAYAVTKSSGRSVRLVQDVK